MHRSVFILIAAMAGLGAVGCASSKPNARPAAAAPPAKELVLDVVRGGMSEETYRAMLVAISQSFQKAEEKMAAADGRKPHANTAALIAEIVGEEIPYETMVGIMANMYLRHFTEAELKEIAAFQQTAVYRKQMGVIATLMSEAGTEVQNIIIARRPAI